MNEENFLVIYGWMMSRLHLNGARLLLYAVLYSFSKDPRSRGFKGYSQALRAFCRDMMPSSSYYDAKKYLEEQGLIVSRGGYFKAVVPSTVPRELLKGPQPTISPSGRSEALQGGFSVH